MQCEICGKEGPLFIVKVEGTKMEVCSRCSVFGEVLKEIKNDIVRGITENKRSKEINISFIKKNCSKLIKENREKLGLKQEELANELNLKESIIHKIESGAIEPDMNLARKLEKFFKIKLVDSYVEKKDNSKIEETKEMTIGDLLKEKD
ncbi:MAG: TIGR00270 family protein [Nanoarchaeota archaeon]|nr:TIGR00270 family protein [Nanoarchaeota archaeon]